MDDRNNMAAKALIALAVVGILFVVVREQMESSRNDAWAALAKARADGFSIEALESARDEVRGTEVEPWCGFYLASELYSAGEDLARARQVAQETLDQHGDHATAPMLQDLLAALTSYDRAG